MIEKVWSFVENKKAAILVVFVFVLQIFFSLNALKIKPAKNLLTSPPSTSIIEALSLGDYQFAYRILGIYLQNAGDSWGKFTPLDEYDYNTLEKWFYLIETLDNKSNYLPFIVAFNYGITIDENDSKVIIKWLTNHSKKDFATKWRWFAHALYLSKHRIKDLELSLKIAREFSGYLALSPNIPIWVRQLPAFIMSDAGEVEAAKAVMFSIMETDKNISDNEILFMQDFINKRLQQ